MNDVSLPPQRSPQTLGLAEILRIFKRRKILIAATAFLVVILTVFYTARQPVLYEALCKVDIDLNSPKGGVSVTSDAGVASSSEQKMATQLAIISSQSVTWDVIVALNLNDHPAIIGKRARPKSLESLSPSEKLVLIRSVQSGLSVQFERGTEIADIRYRSTDPALASSIANAVGTAYIQRNVHIRYTTTQAASKWIQDQLQVLHQQVDKADQQLTDFQRKTGIVQTDDSRPINADRISQLTGALSTAQALRITKETALQESNTSEPDLVLPATSLPSLLALRTQKSNLDAQYASLSSVYGDAYPRVAQLKSQIAQVQKDIDSEVTRGRQQLLNEYKAAAINEESLRRTVDDENRKVLDMNENMLEMIVLRRQLAASRNLYDDLTLRLQEAQISSGLSIDSIATIDPALQPYIPSEPRKTFNLEVGALLGIILGLAAALLSENINATIRSLDDVRIYAGLDVLGLIPHVGMKKNREERKPDRDGGVLLLGPHVASDPNSPFTEAFRNLRSSILLSSPGKPPQTILMCSAWPKEGKSTCSINLAVALAQTDKRVLLVDADLKRPSLHLKLGYAANGNGLSNLLTSSDSQQTREFIKSGVLTPQLDFLSSGQIPPSSAELLLSTRMKELLEYWRADYDFIVLDTAPLLAVSDSTALVSLADTTILVVRSGITRRQSLRALRDVVLSVRGRIAGVLVNDVKTDSEAYYDYYGGYGSYAGYDKRTDVYGAKPND